MKRSLIFLVLGAAILAAALPGMRVNDDPIASLLAKDTVSQSLFSALHANSFFRGRIFVDFTKLDENVAAKMEEQIRAAGYQRESLVDSSRFRDKNLQPYWSLIPPEELTRIFAPDQISKRASEIASLMSLPGSSGMIDQIATDPFDILKFLSARIAPTAATDGATEIHTYRGPATTDYPSVGKLYDFLLAHASPLGFVGGDFFAYENYLAIKGDISLCLMISLPLNLLIFFYFTRHWRLLFFLVAGSAFSYATGLGLVRVFYTEIFTLVFAFTSTFVGFNNEYLIHLSGLESHKQRVVLVSLGSAIGTTLIGFLALLFSDSVIIRQMALISLGGMIGFLAFLLSFQPTLEKVRFREFRVPHLKIGNGPLIAVWGTCLAFMAWLGMPNVSTNIDAFRYGTGRLEAPLQRFQAKTPSFNATDTYAVRIQAPDVMQDFLSYQNNLADGAFHPLKNFPPPDRQRASLTVLDSQLPRSIRQLERELFMRGVDVPLNQVKASDFKVWTAKEFLYALNDFSPLPWIHAVESQEYLYLPLKANAASQLSVARPMGPRHYYDILLTDMSLQMGKLFLLGLFAMVVFLIPVQRRLGRILYIFAPLLVTALLFFAWLQLRSAGLNFVHFMGFALVIALAIDYAAVAVSTHFAPIEMAKITLTGLCTIASFGALMFARHPVLRDLGATVTVGATLALLFTLFFRYDDPNSASNFGVEPH